MASIFIFFLPPWTTKAAFKVIHLLKLTSLLFLHSNLFPCALFELSMFYECDLVGLQSVWQVAYIRTAGAWWRKKLEGKWKKSFGFRRCYMLVGLLEQWQYWRKVVLFVRVETLNIIWLLCSLPVMQSMNSVLGEIAYQPISFMFKIIWQIGTKFSFKQSSYKSD